MINRISQETQALINTNSDSEKKILHDNYRREFNTLLQESASSLDSECNSPKSPATPRTPGTPRAVETQNAESTDSEFNSQYPNSESKKIETPTKIVAKYQPIKRFEPIYANAEDKRHAYADRVRRRTAPSNGTGVPNYGFEAPPLDVASVPGKKDNFTKIRNHSRRVSHNVQALKSEITDHITEDGVFKRKKSRPEKREKIKRREDESILDLQSSEILKVFLNYLIFLLT